MESVNHINLFKLYSLVLLMLMVLLTACGDDVSNFTPVTASATFVPLTPTPTFKPPTYTPVPLAARVNSVEITLAHFQAELARYQQSVGTELATEDEELVIQELIDQYLLAQAAQESGFFVEEAMLQERINQLMAQLGGAEALEDWMRNNGYTQESFRQDLARSLAAAWMRDQILRQVPETAEQVHVRQILLYNSDQANEVLAQLQAGKDFATLAAQYDAITYGDLGWFPRGYLLDAKLEEVAFSLQPGEFSDVIQTHAGFHIIQVVEIDPQHPLAPQTLLVLQKQALQNWLEAERAKSQIDIFLP